jgi:exopolysaccharide biosynthesis polyprenyl glycosylphosphotransferase
MGGRNRVRFGRRATWWLVVSDLVLINIALVAAYWMRYELRWFVEVGFDATIWDYLPFTLILSILLPITFKLDGVYNVRRGQSWFFQMYAIVNATAKGTIVLLALTFFFRPLVYSRLLFLEAALLIVIFTGVSRLVKGYIEARLRRRGIGVDRVLIVGGGEIGRTVIRTIVARPELGYQIIGLVDDNPDKGRADIGRVKGLGGLDKLAEIVDCEAVDQVLITLPWMYHRKIMGIVHECQRKRVEARIVPDMFQMSLSQVDVDDLGGIPLIGVRKTIIGRGQRVLKRLMDVMFATLGGFLALPLMGVIGLAIRLDSPGPAVFRQLRVGKSGRQFWCYKFRSMHQGAEDERERLQAFNEADGPLFKIRDDPRRTRVGRWLRRTSLDELPQLYNVLRGEMSVVGPRPPLPEEVARYEAWQMRRLEVAPGITGLWQVSGRSNLSFDEQCLLDIYYIENWSPFLDITILLRTVPKVFTGDGAY